MTSERVYTALLRLYPESFRREYCDDMLYAFRRIRRDVRGLPVLFWMFIVQDVIWSACQEHVRAWTADEKRLIVRWLVGCTGGGILSVALIEMLGYPLTDDMPRMEMSLPLWQYGALFGLALGAAQGAALRHHLQPSAVWIAVSAAAGAVGLPVALAINSAPGLVNEFARAAVMGTFVGGGQAVALRLQVRGAGQWVIASSIGFPLGALCDQGLGLLLHGKDLPHGWLSAAVGLALLPAICGLVLGAVTAKPLTSMLSSLPDAHNPLIAGR